MTDSAAADQKDQRVMPAASSRAGRESTPVPMQLAGRRARAVRSACSRANPPSHGRRAPRHAGRGRPPPEPLSAAGPIVRSHGVRSHGPHMFLRRHQYLIDGLALPALLLTIAISGWVCYPTVDADDTAQFNVYQNQHEAHGFGASEARVDSQITLRIPTGQAEAVYDYVVAKYQGKTDLLKDRF